VRTTLKIINRTANPVEKRLHARHMGRLAIMRCAGQSQIRVGEAEFLHSTRAKHRQCLHRFDRGAREDWAGHITSRHRTAASIADANRPAMNIFDPVSTDDLGKNRIGICHKNIPVLPQHKRQERGRVNGGRRSGSSVVDSLLITLGVIEFIVGHGVIKRQIGGVDPAVEMAVFNLAPV